MRILKYQDFINESLVSDTRLEDIIKDEEICPCEKSGKCICGGECECEFCQTPEENYTIYEPTGSHNSLLGATNYG